MKKVIMSLAVAMMVTTTVCAQQIAVVKGSVTNTYQTLQEAIEGAQDNSVIYLPGGGFTIADSVKITKRLTIMGVSHRGDTDNADGASVISGNLFFEGGSSGSAVMGCYVSGDINVGTETAAVTDFTARYINANSIQVKNSECYGMVVNQSYLRGASNFGNCNVRLTNNIFSTAQNINGGIVNHNIITSWAYYWTGSYGGNQQYTLWNISNSTLTNNYLINYNNYNHWSKYSDCYISNNCIGTGSWGDNPITLDEGKSWDDVFKANKGVSIASDYHLIGTWGKGTASDGSDLGIYGGSGFSDKALAPIPYISEKKIAEQTDAAGKLSIRIKVNAGGSDGSSQGGATGGSDSDVSIGSGDEDGM